MRFARRQMNRPINTIDPDEIYHAEKEAIRGVLREQGYRRDGRCKKFETYKKRINGRDHRVKFESHSATFDSFVNEHDRMGGGERNRWNNINTLLYQIINLVTQIERFLGIHEERPSTSKAKATKKMVSKYERTQDDYENEEYLLRMGIS